MKRRLHLPISRRGWVALGAVAALVAGLLLLVRGLLRPKDPTWERILATGLLRVCTDPSWPPFESVDPATGEIIGLDADLARLLAMRLAPGLRAEFVTVGFDGLYDALIAGRCDALLSALPYDPARTRDVAYSISYFDAGSVLVIRQGTPGIGGVGDLEGRAVGADWAFVPEGSRRQRLSLGQMSLRRYDTADDLLRAVQSGEIDAALVDRIAAIRYLRQCPGLEIVGEPLASARYVLAVRPDGARLLGEIDRVLLEMRQDGTLENLQERWF